MTEKACHVVASTAQVGLIQALWLMLTLSQTLVILAITVMLLSGYAFARQRSSGRGVRFASSLLPIAFIVLAIFCDCNALNMISLERVALSIAHPQTYTSDSLYYCFLIALQLGASVFFAAAAVKTWQRRNEA